MRTSRGLSVEDIRPKKSLHGQKKAIDADVRALLRHKKNFVHVHCPACGSQGSMHIFRKRGFNYDRCNTCRTFYISPRPTADLLAEFYKTSKVYAYWSKTVFPASEAKRRANIVIPRVERVLELCRHSHINRQSLIEVGCGYGTFCKEMQIRKAFRRILGIEPSSELAAMSRKKGITVLQSTIEQAALSEESTVDVLVSFEVIEHLFSPVQFLKSCRRMLRRRGLMIFTCPNGEGFDVATLGTVSDTIDHEHLNYFNPDSVRLLCRRAGLRVIEVTTPGKLDADLVRQKIVEGEMSIPTEPFLKKVLIDEWDRLGASFQRFLADHTLSSHMWVVAVPV